MLCNPSQSNLYLEDTSPCIGSGQNGLNIGAYNTGCFNSGCMDSTAFNYDPLATLDDSSCIAFAYGCIDSAMFNYNASANTDDGSCIAFVYGCMDSTMFNYNVLANTDDGSCIAIAYGCTDSIATNFNPNATVDDSTCCGSGIPLPQPNLGPNILLYCNKDTSLSYYNITLNLNPGAGYSNYQWMSIIHDPYNMGVTWDNDTTFLGTDPTYTFSGNTDTITVFNINI